MERRTYVKSAIGVACISFSAGCTGGNTSARSGQSSSSDGGSQRANTPSGPPEQKAAEHLEKAGKALENAGNELDSESEKFTSSEFREGTVDIQTSGIYGYFDRAEAELNAATEFATDDQEDLIDAIEEFVEFGRALVKFLDTFADGYSESYTGFTYLQSERYRDAIAQLRKAEETLQDASDLLTVSRTRFDDLDPVLTDELDQVNISKFNEDLDKLERLLPVLITVAVGSRYLSRGMLDYQTAQDHFEAEDLASAAPKFERAAEDFGLAYSEFKAQEDTAPSEVKSTVIEMTCYSKSLRDGSTHLADGSKAYERGDRQRAEELFDEARTAFNRCNFDDDSGT
jgi:tetratricopeptide (TPR) repeat protein